jgi:hypothetical protein
MTPAPADLLPWAAGPTALYLAARALSPWLARWGAGHETRLVRWWQGAQLGQALQTLLQFAFYVGIPYAGLVTGALDLRSLGLTGVDALGTVALAALVAAASLILFGGAQRLWTAGQGGHQGTGLQPPAWQRFTVAAAVAFALQAHLALYRAALFPAAGADLAPFAALALVAMERVAGAVLAGRWAAADAAGDEAETLAAVTAGSIVLWGANSLPGAMAVHAAVAFGVGRDRGERS